MTDSQTGDDWVWLDLEMTGLDPDYNQIIEIATLVTNSNLEILGEGPNLVIFQPEKYLQRMDNWNQEHHGNSGLLDQVRASRIEVHEAEQQTLEFLRSLVKAKAAPLCGNTIGQDRRFLVRYMPELHDFFHYRSIDVSTLKELARHWRPGVVESFTKQSSHRALDDIRESIAELQHYRKHFLG